MDRDDEEPTQQASGPVAARLKPTPPRPGGTFGRYTLLEQAGRGGMGEVYAAWDPQLARRVAIKLIGSELQHRETEQARLVREARALARLQHPNVVSVYELGVAEGQLYVAMEFVEGRTLRVVLREDRPPEAKVRELLTAAGRGLAAIHAAGLVHRDFKPGNVLVGIDGRVRLMDFGLARPDPSTNRSESEGTPAAPEEPRSDASSSASFLRPGTEDEPITLLGASAGTPRFMPPEQIRGEAPDARSDQFAFAVVAWHALTGQYPFPDPGDDVVRRVESIEAGPRLETGRKLDRALRKALVRALSARAADRFPELAPLLDELSGQAAIRRRWRTGAIAATLLVPTIAFGLHAWESHARRRCEAGVLREAAVPAVALAELGRKVRETLGEQAEAVGVEDELAGWLDRWAAQASYVCLAERRDQALAVSGQKACLDGRLAETTALLGLFDEGARDVLEMSRAAVRGLPSVDGCALAPPIEAPPDTRETAARAVARRELSTGRAALLAGAIEPASRAAAQVLAAELAAQDEGLRAQALLLRARARDEAGGKAAESAEDYLAVLRGAALARDERLEAEAWSGYLYLLTARLRELPTAVAVLPLAEAAVERTGDPLLRVALLQSRSSLRLGQNDATAEVTDLTQALALLEQHAPRDTRQVGKVHHMLGSSLLRKHAPEEAAAHLRRAIELFEEVMPADHPTLAWARNNLGLVYERVGERPRARALYEQARDAMLRRLGPLSSQTAAPFNNLGDLHLDDGELDAAEQSFEQSRRALEASLGANHIRTSIALAGLAKVRQARGRLDEARRTYLTLIEVRRAAGDGRRTRELTCLLAGLELEAGDVTTAARLLAEVAPPAGEPDLPERVVLHALVELARGRREEARTAATLAAEFLQTHPFARYRAELDGIEARLATPPAALPARLPHGPVRRVLERLASAAPATLATPASRR